MIEKCKDNPSAAQFIKHLLVGKPQTRETEGGILLHEPIRYKKLVQFKMSFKKPLVVDEIHNAWFLTG